MSQPIPRLGAMPSRWRTQATPIASVLLASALPALVPIVVQTPSLPPFGLLVLVGWRLLHHELWPLWIGAPLGAFDDIMSGQPLGTAIFLWSVVMIAIEMVDARLYWRDYWHDWFIAIVGCFVFLAGGLLLSRLSGNDASLSLIFPQLLWSALLYPLIVRMVAGIDRWRMMA